MNPKKYPVCACDKCKAMCVRPCAPTPFEAIKIINAGFGDRFSYYDKWNRKGDYYYLRPAKKGEEGLRESSIYSSCNQYWKLKCTFQDEITGLCELHDLGLKPIEAKIAFHDDKKEHNTLHDRIVSAWNNQKAQDLFEQWMKCYCRSGT